MNAFERNVLEHLVLPRFIPKPPHIKIATINMSVLYCRIIENKNESSVAYPVQESPFYKYNQGDTDTALRNLQEKLGTKRPNAKLMEFQALVNNFEYLPEEYRYNYICTYERGKILYSGRTAPCEHLETPRCSQARCGCFSST